jgi:hypothetical protein
METRTRVIPVKVSDTLTLLVEARALGGEEDVSSKFLSFKPVTDAIEAITSQVATTPCNGSGKNTLFSPPSWALFY